MSSNIRTYDRVDGRLARGRDIHRISGIYIHAPLGRALKSSTKYYGGTG